MPVCAACGTDNPDGTRFCGSCGAALAVGCPSCGTENPAGFRFCGSCGSALGDDAATAPEAPSPTLGERRRVTVLFADLVGFSTLAEHLDPEELRTLMTDTFAELTEEVESREGWVEKFIGDAVVAVFGAPVTHEDDPARAVETALAMLEVARRRSEGTPTPLELRVGINSGLVVAGAVGDGTQTGVMGDAVNVAARLQQTADPGEILLAASTWRRIRNAFDTEPVGALEVKGKAQPVEAYRLRSRREADVRQRAPFVGRTEELALLELLWSSARKGNTHVVSVGGEPGVGKSRLLSEFRPADGALDLPVSCGGEHAFGPFLELIDRILGGTPSDVSDLKAKAAALGIEEDDALPLAPFVGLGEVPPVVRMADETQKGQSFAGFWQFLLAVCRMRPACIALDDVHWADESSRDLLDFLLEALGGVPLMLILCYRPGFEQVERAELRASHTAVRLEPLSEEESVALARGFLGVEDMPADLERLIAGRAEGNPFFIEELLQALLELGSLAVVDGKAVLAKVEVDVPDTVQGTILARVDRLEAHVRNVLQHAAVLGRTFSTELLESVIGKDDLSEPLALLSRAQLVVALGPGEWAFKHALIQEVTYETLLLRSRQELHRKVAESLERRAGEDPTLLEALAEHYARANAPEEARRYAVSAGDIAQERLGIVEAKRRYETALRLWGEGDEQGRLELLMKLAVAANLGGDLATARTALIEAEERWRELGDLRRSSGALARLGRIYWQLGEGERAVQTLANAIEALKEHGPSSELVEAYTWASTVHMLGGTVTEGSELAKRGLELAEQLGLDGFRAQLLNTLGACEVFAGDPRGVERIEEALVLAQEVGEAEALVRAYNNLSSTYCDLGRFRKAAEIGREGREVSRRLGAPGFEWFIAGNEAWALLNLGRFDDAQSLLDEILDDQQRAALAPPGIAQGLWGAAVLAIRLGSYDQARVRLDESMGLARGLGGSEFLARHLECEAELELARGNVAAARQAIREAVEIDFATPARESWLRVTPLAARLLSPEEVEPLLERVRDLPSHPYFDAQLAEAEGVFRGDRERSRKAAELYRSLDIPYDEARCRIDAGEFERAREIVEEFGLENGPLGARLAAAV